MQTATLPTSIVSDLARQPLNKVYQWFNNGDCQPLLPSHSPTGSPRRFNGRETLLFMIMSNFERWGLKVPFAAKLAARIAETLAFNASATHVHIEFRDNGASFTFTGDEAPDAADAAGPAMFRLTINLEAYRAAIDAALTERAQATGADNGK